jgi:GTPase Era involved in 16S rRNA processing
MTRAIQLGKCREYSNFVFIDTPGTSSTLQTKKHAMLLKSSLELQPVNALFIITEYKPRATDTIDNFEDLMNMVINYKKNVVLLVSKFDSCQKKEKEKYIKIFLEEFSKR